MTTFFKNFN